MFGATDKLHYVTGAERARRESVIEKGLKSAGRNELRIYDILFKSGDSLDCVF